MFSVYDSKAKVYMQPFYMMNKGTAIRAFDQTCNDPKSQFHQYPEDFTLFEVGEFDDENCNVTSYIVKESLGNAIEFLKKPTIME